jgi:PGF-pre-PGF domain-containing protein
MRMKVVLFIFALLVSIQTTAASDIGVGASPGNLNYRLAPGSSAEQSLYVINTGTETATYSVFVDESAYSSWFTFSISSFELRAGENKEVKVRLSVPASAEEDVDCKIKVPCTVPEGDVGTGIIIPVHIELLSSVESSSGGNSGSGSSSISSASSGSSSGGGGSPEPASNVETRELTQQYVESGNHIRFEFTQDVTCVKYVEFDAKKSLGKITTVVEQLKERSTLTPVAPEGEVYGYMNIWAGNEGIASPENIENSIIGFKVDKSWISENDIDSDSIALDHYDGEKWEPMSVKEVEEDDGYLYLEAETPGFSQFAITGKKSDETEKDTGMAPITRAGEKLKDTAENLESTVVKSFEEKSPMVLAGVEGYKEKIQEFFTDLIHSLQEKDWFSQG